MDEPLRTILGLVAGVALGSAYFAGLWWTVRRSMSSARPAILLLSSAVLRTALLIAGFYVVSGGRWRPLLGCLAGFIGAKLLAVRLGAPRAEALHGD